MLRKNRLDVYDIRSTQLGFYRDAFDRVVELSGFVLKPVEDSNFVWDFQHAESGERGRLLHVSGMLGEGRVSISVKGMAYMVTRQDYTLALGFSTAPRSIWLSEANYRVVPKEKYKTYPSAWPKELIGKVIRTRFRTVVIADESYLLQTIGLRKPAGVQ